MNYKNKVSGDDYIIKLPKDNPFNGMKRSEFLKVLDFMGVEYEDGNGEIIFTECEQKKLQQTMKILFNRRIFMSLENPNENLFPSYCLETCNICCRRWNRYNSTPIELYNP